MLEIHDLSVAYGKHRALEAVSLRVDPGEIVVILGANGAGKSTLLKAVSGICEGRVEGAIAFGGHDLAGLPPDRIVEEGIALVPEGRGIFGDLSVEENLTLGAYPNRARDEQAANLARVYALFPKLIERRKQVARTMSGGEQQMVAIGRAMMSNPRILTLDEPSLGLSPLLCKELFQNLKAVRDAGIGILLVEQNARQSLAIADRGYLLENAHIIHEDTADALMHDPAVQAAYLGAGGAAAPHTHGDDTSGATDPGSATGSGQAASAPSSSQASAPASVPLPARMKVAPRPGATLSADTLLGTSISDLVAGASQTARQEVEGRSSETRGLRPGGKEDATQRLRSAVNDIEAAARRARTAGARRIEKPVNRADEVTQPPDRTSAPPTAHPSGDRPSPVTIEVYRAPRVEIYRRRPGSGKFERD